MAIKRKALWWALTLFCVMLSTGVTVYAAAPTHGDQKSGTVTITLNRPETSTGEGGSGGGKRPGGGGMGSQHYDPDTVWILDEEAPREELGPLPKTGSGVWKVAFLMWLGTGCVLYAALCGVSDKAHLREHIEA